MKLSFIIPTLNEEKVLAKLLINLREIREFKFEIIVSDGKSSDRTVDIAKKLGAKVVENLTGQRQTIGEGRNAGAAVAVGDYFIFLDADVYITEPDKFFAGALQNFAMNKKLLAVSGWIRVFPETETWADYLGYVILSDWQFYIKNNLLGIGATCGEFQMMTSAVFKKLNGYREDLVMGEDLDLFYRISRLGKTKTDRSLVIYHTGRRPRAIGWPRLIWQWVSNSLHIKVLDRAHTKEWEPIR
jgi:glycosyltransferase involved in cell wall biosynthesis